MKKQDLIIRVRRLSLLFGEWILTGIETLMPGRDVVTEGDEGERTSAISSST